MTLAQASYARFWIARGMSVDWVVDTCPYGKPWDFEATRELRHYAATLKYENTPQVEITPYWQGRAEALSRNRSA